MELLGAKPKWYDFINLQTYDIWHDSYIGIKEKNKLYKNVGHSLCIYNVIFIRYEQYLANSKKRISNKRYLNFVKTTAVHINLYCIVWHLTEWKAWVTLPKCKTFSPWHVEGYHYWRSRTSFLFFVNRKQLFRQLLYEAVQSIYTLSIYILGNLVWAYLSFYKNIYINSSERQHL